MNDKSGASILHNMVTVNDKIEEWPFCTTHGKFGLATGIFNHSGNRSIPTKVIVLQSRLSHCPIAQIVNQNFKKL